MNQYKLEEISANNRVSVYIRPMQLLDLEQVQSIDRMSFTLPWPASAFRYELLDNPRSLLWVAESNTQVNDITLLGLIVVWLILDEVHIATLAVHPDFREQGIGQRLLVTALQEAASRGSRIATLEVRANNLAAQALYRKFLFDITGKRIQYYQDNHEDALIMTLNPINEAYIYWLESGEWQKRSVRKVKSPSID